MKSLIITVLLLISQFVYPINDAKYCDDGINVYKDTIPRALPVDYLYPKRYVTPIPRVGDFRIYKKRTIDTLCTTVKIDNISTVKGGYIIDVYNTSDEKLYRIVTLRKRHLKKIIKIGESYVIKYWPYSYIETYPNLGVTNVIEFKGKTLLIPTATFTFNFYLTNDLDGLKYIRTNNNCE